MLNLSDAMGYDSITQLNREGKETETGLLVMSAHFWQRHERIQDTRDVGTVLPCWILAMTDVN